MSTFWQVNFCFIFTMMDEDRKRRLAVDDDVDMNESKKPRSAPPIPLDTQQMPPSDSSQNLIREVTPAIDKMQKVGRFEHAKVIVNETIVDVYRRPGGGLETPSPAVKGRGSPADARRKPRDEGAEGSGALLVGNKGGPPQKDAGGGEEARGGMIAGDEEMIPPRERIASRKMVAMPQTTAPEGGGGLQTEIETVPRVATTAELPEATIQGDQQQQQRPEIVEIQSASDHDNLPPGGEGGGSVVQEMTVQDDRPNGVSRRERLRVITYATLVDVVTGRRPK